MTPIPRLAIAAFLASAAAAAPEAARFTAQQLEAVFYFDLGADSVDVSDYPKAQRGNYAAFVAVCSRCHTLARPINSPIAAAADWRRYVRRMHVRSKSQADKTFDKEQIRGIVDFLAYDSRIRKIAGKSAFDAETQRLKKLFAEVRAEAVKTDQRRTEKP